MQPTIPNKFTHWARIPLDGRPVSTEVMRWREHLAIFMFGSNTHPVAIHASCGKKIGQVMAVFALLIRTYRNSWEVETISATEYVSPMVSLPDSTRTSEYCEDN